jgi:MFS family permease
MHYSYDILCFQLGWVCDKAALPTIAQAVFFGGAILGGLIFGWVADRYGRIPALVWTNIIGFIAGIATSFVTTFWAFCVCRFLVGLAFDNCFTMMYILGEYWVYFLKTEQGMQATARESTLSGPQNHYENFACNIISLHSLF